MKFQYAVRAIVIGAMVATLGAGSAFAKEEKGAAPKMDPAGEAAMMAEMMKMAAPGPEHKVLEGSLGKWKTVTKSYTAPGDPKVEEGTAEYEAILGGRFFMSRHRGSMMGMPFEGFSVMGYDRVTKTYEGYWTDNMGTALYPMSKGTWDEATKTLSFDVVWPNPMGGTAPFKLATKFNGNDAMVFTMSAVAEGKPMPLMEVSYSRVK